MFPILSLLTASQAAELPVRVLLTDTSIAFPFGTSPFATLHPGVLVGLPVWQRHSGHFHHRIELETGFAHVAPIETALSLVPSWQTTFWTRALGLSLLAGLGYKHAFDAGHAYVLRDGAYTPGRRAGNPGLTAQIGLGVDVRVHEHVTVVAQVRSGLEGPYNPALTAVLPRTWTLLGVEVRR